MIDILFNYGNDVVLVKINGHSVLFGSTMFGNKMADISGLRLDFNGTIREFPDLQDNLDWREEAIKRFKQHIKLLDKEEEIADYIIKELRTKGYTPKLKQVAGHRAMKLV